MVFQVTVEEEKVVKSALEVPCIRCLNHRRLLKWYLMIILLQAI